MVRSGARMFKKLKSVGLVHSLEFFWKDSIALFRNR